MAGHRGAQTWLPSAVSLIFSENAKQLGLDPFLLFPASIYQVLGTEISLMSNPRASFSSLRQSKQQ